MRCGYIASDASTLRATSFAEYPAFLARMTSSSLALHQFIKALVVASCSAAQTPSAFDFELFDKYGVKKWACTADVAAP